MDYRIAEFLAWLRLDQGLAENSLIAYRTDLEEFRAVIEPKDLLAASSDDIRAWLEKFESRSRCPATIQRKISALRTFWKFLRQTGLADNFDPTTTISAPRRGRQLPKALTEAEVDAIFRELDRRYRRKSILPIVRAAATRDALTFSLLYASGLRATELCQLEPGDLDLDRHTMRVRGKGNRERVIPFGAATEALLRTYLANAYPLLNPGFRTSALIVGGNPQTPRPLTRQELWKWIGQLGSQVGLNRKLTPHMLRHSFASHLLAGGMHLRGVQMLLGHRDISTTQIYTAIEPSFRLREYRKYHPRK